MERHEIRVGRIYTFTHAGTRQIVRVDKINPKNIKASTATGQRWNVHPTFLTEATSWEQDEFSSTVSASPPASNLTLGSVVKFKASHLEGLYVVVGSHGGTWRVAKLGGDKGRYFRGIADFQLEVVEFETEGV